VERALLELCDYTEAWRERLRQSFAGVPPGGWDRPVTAGGAPVGHGSLRDTVVHIVLVEDDWQVVDIDGRHEVDLEPDYAPEGFADLDAILAKGVEVRERFRARTPSWREPVHLPKRDFDTTVGDILMHVLLHEVAHHGDLTTILAALGAPELNYYFVRHRMAQAGKV
jgi:uncharacterized damage-inducible protein DinB